MIQAVLFYIIIFLCCLYFKKNDYSQKELSFFNINYTNILRGIAIIIIMSQHIAGACNTRYLTPLGGIGLAVFLIISGFGLSESFKKKQLQGFWKKKIARVFIPYIIIDTIFFFFSDYSINYYLLDISGYKTTLWFVGYILRWYIAFYVIYRFFYKYRLFLLVAVSVIFLFSDQLNWSQQAFSFVVGIFISEYDSVKTKLYVRRNVISMIMLVIGIFFLGLKQIPIVRNYDTMLTRTILELFIKLPIALVVTCQLYNIHVITKNRFLLFIGNISYELYMVHMFLRPYFELN